MDWHLNKNVSISIIVLLCINIGSTIWWASALNTDVQTLKNRPDLTERVIRLEARSDEHGRLLQKIDMTLDKLNTTINVIAKEQAKRTPLVYGGKK